MGQAGVSYLHSHRDATGTCLLASPGARDPMPNEVRLTIPGAEPSGAPMRPRWNLLIAAALCALWLLLSLSRMIYEVLPGSTAWYPPAALVAAACIVWGGRAVIPFFVAGVISAEVSGHHAGEPLWLILLLSFSLKATYWAAALVLRRLRFDPSFERPADVVRFVVVMACAGLITAALGIGYAVSVGTVAPAQLVRAVVMFWMGDLTAVLALTPLLLAGARLLARLHPRAAPVQRSRVTLQGVLQVLSLPVTLLFAAIAAPRVGVLAFGVGFIPLGWIAVTQGVAGATIMSAALDVGAITSHSWMGGQQVGNLELQTLIASLAITGLLLGSVAQERERARRLLAQSEERYRALVELLPEPLLVHRNGRVLFANPAAARVLGAASPRHLRGVALEEMAAPESREQIRERLDRLSCGEPVTLAEHRLVKLDSSGMVDVESVSTPIDFDGGRAALTVARDVTASRRLAEELRHAHRLESLGQLAGGVAHDFNNLLGVIISYCELLLREIPGNSALREYAEGIDGAAERAASLTRQLLTFSRKRMGQAKRVRLDEVARGGEKLLERLIGPPVRMRFVLGETGLVLVDAGHMEQVIVNLAVNARDAMPEGGDLVVETGTARFRAPDRRWPGLPPGEYATLFVRDTGHGMDAEVRSRVFDPFFSTKAPGKGTGLGLATAYGIVKQAGGFIFVESEPNAGSLFAIFLPRAQGTPESVHPLPARSVAPPKGTRVLLVEDDASVRAATRRLLESIDCAVVEAADGVAALRHLDGGAEVDVVLSDVSMPNMNGPQLVRALRERGSGVPAVLTSAFPVAGSEGDEPRVLQKPLRASDLAIAIADAIQRPQLGGSGT